MVEFIYSAFCDEGGESTIEGQIATCKANNITHMELRNFGKDLTVNNLTVSQAEEMKKVIDANEMKVASIGSRYGKIKITDDFEPHFEEFKNTVEVAKVLEAKYIRLFSFYIDKDQDPDKFRDEVLRRVGIMADYATKEGIICCHENEKGIYGDNWERCLDILENVKNIRGVFDPANFVQCGVDTLKAYDMLKDHIEYMHIKDALYKDNSVVPSGKGDGNVKAILSQVAQKDGSIVLSLEPHLQVFDGLKSLEATEDKSRLMPENTYKSHSESFKAAADAMFALTKEISEE